MISSECVQTSQAENSACLRWASISRVAGSKPTADRQNFLQLVHQKIIIITNNDNYDDILPIIKPELFTEMEVMHEKTRAN